MGALTFFIVVMLGGFAVNLYLNVFRQCDEEEDTFYSEMYWCFLDNADKCLSPPDSESIEYLTLDSTLALYVKEDPNQTAWCTNIAADICTNTETYQINCDCNNTANYYLDESTPEEYGTIAAQYLVLPEEEECVRSFWWLSYSFI